ncbi:Uncharacterised protein [Kluyvera cryocrescens]|uniref:Uncharacterized protein n=1 Tax=Kluyvera cryocrescens TaxID=580 RepID=A0A485ABB1_KLUCR|nr:Uncharacterised protein [Kluyvera cryocrescens]
MALRIVPYRLIGKPQQFTFLNFRAAISVDMLMPKAPDSLANSAAVGLLSPRSILWIIARETLARSARSLSDQPRDSRSMRILAPIR